MPFRVWPSKELLGSALDAALALGRSVCDCTYLARAIRLDAPLVTADRRLMEAISGGSVKPYVRWIEDAPSLVEDVLDATHQPRRMVSAQWTK